MATPSSSIILSDRNVSLRQSQLVSRKRGYADLDLSLTLHPDFHDIIPLTDLDAIKNSVRNLVLTNYYERPFQPYLAGNLQGVLFENWNRFTGLLIKDRIKNILERKEPRIDQVNVVVDGSAADSTNSVQVTISYRVISSSQLSSVTIYLERVR